jgi:hypothetical protein
MPSFDEIGTGPFRVRRSVLGERSMKKVMGIVFATVFAISAMAVPVTAVSENSDCHAQWLSDAQEFVGANPADLVAWGWFDSVKDVQLAAKACRV